MNFGIGTRRLLIASSLAFVAALSACTGSSGETAKAPLEGSGPYLCSVIPKGALAPLFGREDLQVDEAMEGHSLETTETMSCDLYIQSDLTDSMSISVFAGKGRGTEKFFQREETEHTHAARLPAELGNGGIRHTSDEIGSEYIAHALFRCGDTLRWIRILVSGLLT